jgi:putative membrane protein
VIESGPPAKSSIELAEERTELAVFRTSLAASRSLMAWVRTGLSTIGFGFTLYKFVQSFAEAFRPGAPRMAGLFLIGLGTLSVLFGCVEYAQTATAMRSAYGAVKMRKGPLVMAGLIGMLGLALFLSVYLRIT